MKTKEFIIVGRGMGKSTGNFNPLNHIVGIANEDIKKGQMYRFDLNTGIISLDRT